MTDAQRKAEIKRLREENNQLREAIATHEAILQGLLDIDESENIYVKAERETIEKIKNILRNAKQ